MEPGTVFVGFECPRCGQRVIVFTLDDPRQLFADITAECVCGYSCVVPLTEIGGLELWREPQARTA